MWEEDGAVAEVGGGPDEAQGNDGVEGGALEDFGGEGAGVIARKKDEADPKGGRIGEEGDEGQLEDAEYGDVLGDAHGGEHAYDVGASYQLHGTAQYGHEDGQDSDYKGYNAFYFHFCFAVSSAQN